MRILAILFIPAMLGAQQPDCNLARPAFDNPFSDTRGFVLRRYQWHAARAVGAGVLGEVVHRSTHLPRWASFTVAGVTVGILPHIRGVALGHYKFNARDWVFDAFVSAVPLLLWSTWSDTGIKVRTLGTTTLIGGYFAGACYASP